MGEIDCNVLFSRAVVIRPEAIGSVMQQGTGAFAVGGPTPFVAQPSPRQEAFLAINKFQSELKNIGSMLKACTVMYVNALFSMNATHMDCQARTVKKLDCRRDWGCEKTN
ncbi:hypothetical protein KIN20_028633 [Parelaphostrongylus tenuis]|uniref:Uncharacterized protein n=1 Tax=Parelaphostrongylus tenuis TaxID=148309 RepID=A0AAD5R1E8_PARTN|nr:hypothetical protein KIN20_028619 [Parelaphostrongylus tenuis]KAJ1367676.1 hypothetical protein KIN20_028633 [Parelaphostrongylus tenuis]